MKRSLGQGFILVLTTLIIASSVLLISLVINRVNAYRHLSTLWVDVEKARCIALGGIEIAVSQLMPLYAKEGAEEEKGEKPANKEVKGEKKEPTFEEKTAPARVLLQVLNRWQVFSLKENLEGVEGECHLYISSEEGKINLNTLYDFKKKELKKESPDAKKISAFLTDSSRSLFEKAKQKPLQFSSVFEKLFKDRKAPLNDVTELLSLPDVARIQETSFIEPESKKVMMTDLFTVSTSTSSVNPLLFSKTVGQLAGLGTPPTTLEEPKVLEELAALMKAPKIEWETAWQRTLSKIYSKDYRALPETLKPLFATRFEANVFSVVSYGKVGSITQKVCAIIEKNKDTSPKNRRFIYKRLYWI